MGTNLQLPLPSGSFKHPSKPSNYQECVNYIPTSSGPDGCSKITLMPTYGNEIINDDAEGPVRFIKNINGIIYTVIGNTFYSSTVDLFNRSLSLVEIGTLNSSTGVVKGTNNPTQIMLVDGSYGYIYNFIFAGTVPLGPIGGTASDTYTLTINSVSIYSGSDVSTQLQPEVLVSTINTHTAATHVTASYRDGLLALTGDSSITSISVTESGTGFTAGVDGITVSPGVFQSSLAFHQFQQITDTDFVAGTHVIYIDGFFIVNQANSQNFQFSQPNEGRIWNGLDIAAAESKPDKVIGLGASKGEAWVFGSDSIEVWYDNANPTGSPFSKRVGADINIGCIAPYSITNVNDLLTWIDSRGFIVQSDVSALFRNQSSGYTFTKISDEALDAELASYSTLSDAIGMTYIAYGHVMAEFNFPTAGKTWVYDYTLSEALQKPCWHERNYTNTDTGVLEHGLCQFCDTYETTIISGGLRGPNVYLTSDNYFSDGGNPVQRYFTTPQFIKDGQLIGVDGIELTLLTGQTTNTGDLALSQVILQFSYDGGFTWSNELQRPIGEVGEYNRRITWNMLGAFYRWTYRFKVTAPIKHSIIDLNANIDIEAD